MQKGNRGCQELGEFTSAPNWYNFPIKLNVAMRSHQEFSYSIRARSCPRLQQICHWLNLKNIQLGSLFKLFIFKERLKVYHQSCLLSPHPGSPRTLKVRKPSEMHFWINFWRKLHFHLFHRKQLKGNVLLWLGTVMPFLGVSCTFYHWRRFWLKEH